LDPWQETHLSDETEAQNQRTHGFESAKGRSAQQAQRARTTRSSRAGKTVRFYAKEIARKGLNPFHRSAHFEK